MSNPDAYEAQGAVARRSFKARLSAHLANYIERAIAAGMDGDDLVDAINDAFPSITFHDFAGGFALSRGMSAMEARSFFPRGEGNKPTLTNTCALAGAKRARSRKAPTVKESKMDTSKYAGSTFLKLEAGGEEALVGREGCKSVVGHDRFIGRGTPAAR